MRRREKKIKPIVKYTKSESKKIADDLIAWLRSAEENFHIEDYLYVEKGIFKNDVEFLRKEDSYFNLMMEQAEAIELAKLKKFAAGDRLNSSIVKQILINKYGWL